MKKFSTTQTFSTRQWTYDLDIVISRALGESGEPEPDKARGLMRYFVEHVNAGIAPDQRVMQYLATAFDGYLRGGEDADLGKALGVTRRKAGNPGDQGKKNKKSTRLSETEKEALRQEIKARLNQGQSDTTIKAELAETFGISPDTVRDYIRKCRNLCSLCQRDVGPENLHEIRLIENELPTKLCSNCKDKFEADFEEK